MLTTAGRTALDSNISLSFGVVVSWGRCCIVGAKGLSQVVLRSPLSSPSLSTKKNCNVNLKCSPMLNGLCDNEDALKKETGPIMLLESLPVSKAGRSKVIYSKMYLCYLVAGYFQVAVSAWQNRETGHSGPLHQ